MSAEDLVAELLQVREEAARQLSRLQRSGLGLTGGVSRRLVSVTSTMQAWLAFAESSRPGPQAELLARIFVDSILPEVQDLLEEMRGMAGGN